MEGHNVSQCQNHTFSTFSPTHSPTTPPTLRHESQLDYNVAVILAAMICALVCALGLNSMLQCIVRCTRRALSEPVGYLASRRMNAGLKLADVVALPVTTYLAPSGLPAASVPPPGCAICLVDFADGERIRTLPACGHHFHVTCIDTWLLSHGSCPTCRRRLSHKSEVRLEIVTASSSPRV